MTKQCPLKTYRSELTHIQIRRITQSRQKHAKQTLLKALGTTQKHAKQTLLKALGTTQNNVSIKTYLKRAMASFC